jgi:glucan 1,3-beta-glucosidase
MVKLSTVSTLLVYHLQSISYKPVPGNSPAASYVSPFPSLRSSDTSQMYRQDLSKTKSTNNQLVESKILDVTCNVVSYNAPPVLDQEFPPYDRSVANVYRYRQQQSVNLGSW